MATELAGATGAPPGPGRSGDTLDVSVIIPTWNNCRRLAITLDAIAACRVPVGLRFEVIVVANDCADGTAGVAGAVTDRLPLIYLEEPTPGSGIACNKGIAVARGKLLVFADDDVRPAADWLDAYWQAFARLGSGHFYGGPLAHEYETEPDQALLMVANRSIARGFDLGPERRAMGADETPMGANWAAPAAAVREVGAFDPELALERRSGRLRLGEDVDLMERLRRRRLSAIYLPRAHVTHHVPGFKCTRHYVARHIRALGVYSVRRAAVDSTVARRPWLRAWLGEAKWTTAAFARLAGVTAMLGLRCATSRVLGRPAHDDQIMLMYCVGRWQGYVEALRRWRRQRGDSAPIGHQ